MKQKISSFVSCLLFLLPAFGQCELETVEINTGACHNITSYELTLNTQPNDLNVDLFVNSQFLGYFELDSTGLFIDSFPGNGITKDTLLICQNDMDTCCLELLINNPCLCGFANIDYEIYDCDEINETFSIQLDFEPQNNGTSFTLGGNASNYGTFQYSDLPIDVGPLPADNTVYEFIFFDSDDALCFDFIEIGQVDCEEINACSIENVEAEILSCSNSGLFNVQLSFDFTNPSASGFTIQGNGQNYGNFEYDESIAFYELGPFAGDCTTLYEFVILDLEDPECTDFVEFDEPVCCDINVCEIWDLTLQQACEPWWGYIVNFEYAHMPSTQFDLFIDQMYLGTFNYTDLPLMDQLGFPMFIDNFVTIEVFDSEDNECNAELDNVEIGCDQFCSITDLFAEAYDCDEGSYVIDFEFNSSFTSNSFTLYINGIESNSYEYGQTFYTIGPFEDDCETSIELLVVDNQSNSCASEIYTVESPVCCVQPECSISEISIAMLECNAEQMSFVLDFEHIGTVNEFFDVSGRDGFFGFFAFDQLPITITGFPNTGNQFEFIEICENDNEECCQAHEWDLGECFEEPVECNISEISIEMIECNEEEMSFVLDFDYDGTTNEFFDVISRDGSFGFFAFDQLPITITGFPNTGNQFEFIKICESDNEECCKEHEWDLGECFEEPIECNISDISINMIECNEEEMSFVLDFDYVGTTNELFEVTSREGFFGFFAFELLPITITEFPNTGNQFEFIKICENDNEECCQEHEWDLGECADSVSTDETPDVVDYVFSDPMLKLEAIPDQVNIYDLSGRLVYGTINETSINLAHLTTGIYIVRVNQNNSNSSFKLFKN